MAKSTIGNVYDGYVYFDYVDGCRDPDGDYDQESQHFDYGASIKGFKGRCPCDGCKLRRSNAVSRRVEIESRAKEENIPSGSVWNGESFLLPTIRQRAWSFMKALLFGGACVAAVEIAKAVTQ